MPKQAHMAALQARASAKDLLAGLAGGVQDATFKVELMCIIDALDKGTLVWRTPQRQWLLPPLRIFHWLKGRFEKRYLAQYR